MSLIPNFLRNWGGGGLPTPREALGDVPPPLPVVSQSAGGQPGAVAKSGTAGWRDLGLSTTGGTSGEKMTKPYEQSAWIQRAIQLKAGEISSVGVNFYDGETEYSDAAFADWWARPFLGQGGRRLELAEGCSVQAAWTDLEGEIFYILPDEWLVPFPNLRKLPPILIAKPCRMHHIVSRGEIVGWRFMDGAGKSWDLLPEQVIHRPLFNPYDDYRGLAPVKAVFNAAESDYLAGVYTRNLMRNNGDQGVYIIAKNGVPLDGQREQIIQQLKEKRRRAQRGEFSAAFLTGDITVEDPKAQAPGADMNASRLMSRHEVFIGLGVPPSMADIKAAYSTGASSDRYQLITGTCMGQSKMIVAPLGDIASRQTGRVLTARSDWDSHQVMQEARTAKLASADGLWGKGMPMASINDYLGLGMKPFPGWNKSYLPFSVVEVGAEGSDPVTDPALQEEPAATPAIEDDEATAKIRLAILARRQVKARSCVKTVPDRDPFAMFACACHGGGEGFIMKGRDAKQLARWRDYMAKRRDVLRGYESRYTRELMKARAEVLAKINRSYLPPAKGLGTQINKAAAADFMFDLSKWSEGFLAAMRKQGETALGTAGKQLFEELGRDDPFKFPPAEVLQYLRERENKLSNVPQETYDRVKETMEEGIVAGDSTEELTRRVQQEFNDLSRGEARRIATTETAAVYGAGRDEAMHQAGIGFKQWLTSGGDNVRAAHAAANEQVVGIDEFFDVGGEQLQFPGDPAGSAGNVINCHCVSIPVESAEG